MENDQWEMQNDKAGGGMIRHWLQQHIKYPASSNRTLFGKTVNRGIMR
jgi:hypothetical protein